MALPQECANDLHTQAAGDPKSSGYAFVPRREVLNNKTARDGVTLCFMLWKHHVFESEPAA